MCQLPIDPPDVPCRAHENGDDYGYFLCPCERCVNRAADDVPRDAEFIGEFESEWKVACFIEDMLIEKVDEEAELTPTGESNDLHPAKMVENWLSDGTMMTDGYGSYYWLSAKHAEFWGIDKKRE